VLNLAAVARPLTALTRKDPPTYTGGTVQFNDSCAKVLQEMKARFATEHLGCVHLICHAILCMD